MAQTLADQFLADLDDLSDDDEDVQEEAQDQEDEKDGEVGLCSTSVLGSAEARSQPSLGLHVRSSMTSRP